MYRQARAARELLTTLKGVITTVTERSHVYQSRLKSSTAVLQCDHHRILYIVGTMTIQGKEKHASREGGRERCMDRR